jgi:effector-binding domain-containing protein
MAKPHTPEVVELEPSAAALLREVVRMDGLPDFFGRAFHAVASAAAAQGVTLVGPPLGIYFGMPAETIDVGGGFPTDRPIDADDGVIAFTLPGGRAAQVLHVGPYDQMEATYNALMAWSAEQGLNLGPLMWECYLTEPDPAAQEATQTLIVWPLAD